MAYGFDLYLPFRDLPVHIQHLVMHGSGDKEIEFRLEKRGRVETYRRPFEGVLANLARRLEDEERKRKEDDSADGLERFERVAEEFQRYMTSRPCPECHGTRLRHEARCVRIAGRSISELVQLNLAKASALFSTLGFDTLREREVAQRLLREIQSRLSFLCSVGLDYLTLDRSAATLSGGEGQRVRLATQIGASLVGVLYVLDEPSIGLHQRDSDRLLRTLFRLREAGNTVIVVEHDEATIRAADHIVDLGPGAGDDGGYVVAQGTVQQVSRVQQSATGQYLSGVRQIAIPRQRRRGDNRRLELLGACLNNLASVDVVFPIGLLTCVTGVSGSGKSSLVSDTLLPALRQALHGSRGPSGPFRALRGVCYLDKVVAVDQSPIGKTPRSNPATYTGVFPLIRDLFAALPEAKVRGYKSGRFSFNIKGGRCETCRGNGILRIEMHFLPDVFVTCEACQGKRYNAETLKIRYKGFSISDLLDLSVRSASDLLRNIPRLRSKLETLCDVGLGYLALGQPANTLSGGEAQRIKLSRELGRRATGRTIYILDEPTTGLHFADIQVLLDVLNRLVDAGNTVVVIEHNLDVIKSADYVVDLGPEGGDQGGRVVCSGVPEEIAADEQSHTGKYLVPVLPGR
jgi:excinuclease ABC subunit A